jgi:release factor glutamine methyltransferase
LTAIAAGPRVREALAASIDALTAAGVETPRLDAEVMLAEASGLDRARLVAEPETPLQSAASRRFGAMVRRRLQREPVAYILGRKGFRRLELSVDRRVLIPRPETELLVEVALELGPRTVLEVGTGSGAIGLAVADELPDAEVTATDSDVDALDVARANAEAAGLSGRVRFLPGTIPEAKRFDLVVANLPYVSEAEWDRLAPEIREFEPRPALVAGPSGLEAIESLIADLAALSSPPSALALEVGAGQAGSVRELVQGAGYARVESRPDLAGIERVVVGRR